MELAIGRSEKAVENSCGKIGLEPKDGGAELVLLC